MRQAPPAPGQAPRDIPRSTALRGIPRDCGVHGIAGPIAHHRPARLAPYLAGPASWSAKTTATTRDHLPHEGRLLDRCGHDRLPGSRDRLVHDQATCFRDRDRQPQARRRMLTAAGTIQPVRDEVSRPLLISQRALARAEHIRHRRAWEHHEDAVDCSDQCCHVRSVRGPGQKRDDMTGTLLPIDAAVAHRSTLARLLRRHVNCCIRSEHLGTGHLVAPPSPGVVSPTHGHHPHCLW
jgi:hypothetical protein